MRLFALIVCLITATAASADARPTLQTCTQLDDDTARLQCYDAAMGRTPPAATATKASAEPVTKENLHGATPSALTRRWELEESTRRKAFLITAYRPNYMLPFTYNTSPNTTSYEFLGARGELDRAEAKFQISFKTKLVDDVLGDNGDIWFAYTQLSLWQVYNTNFSSPFRETNYEPELLFTYRTDYPLRVLNNRLLVVGFSHQSNGRAEPLSRSWNRITAGALFDRGNLALWARAWYRIPEDDADDDNPNIESYLGYGEFQAAYKLHRHTFALLLRNNFNLNDNRGAVQLDWSFPFFGPLRGYLQYFNGYGESLVDYDHPTNRLGIGVMLTDWL